MCFYSPMFKKNTLNFVRTWKIEARELNKDPVMYWVSILACNKALQINGLLIQVLLPMTVALRKEAYYPQEFSCAFLQDEEKLQVTMKEQSVLGRSFCLSLFATTSRFTQKKIP